jgi:hypothetical protein
LDRTDSTKLRQDVCLVKRTEGHAAKGMKAKLETNNKNFKVLEDTLTSQMDIHKARAEVMQEKTDTNIRI